MRVKNAPRLAEERHEVKQQEQPHIVHFTAILGSASSNTLYNNIHAGPIQPPQTDVPNAETIQLPTLEDAH